MKLDIASLSTRFALDMQLTDYDFWRAIKMIDNELYQIERRGDALPIKMIYARHVLKTARSQRLPLMDKTGEF